MSATHTNNIPVNDNYTMYQLIEDVRNLVNQNKDLLAEMMFLREIYPDYKEACYLFDTGN